MSIETLCSIKGTELPGATIQEEKDSKEDR
jgi:hypothetical protein